MCVCIMFIYDHHYLSILSQIRPPPEECHCFAADFRQARDLVSRGVPLSDALASANCDLPTHRSHEKVRSWKWP